MHREPEKPSENTFAGIELSSANGTRIFRGSPADGMRVWDERGNYAGEIGKPRKPRKPFPEKDRQRAKKNRDQYHTKSWFAKRLLAIESGEVLMTQQQYKALIAYGRLKGWNRRPPSKRYRP